MLKLNEVSEFDTYPILQMDAPDTGLGAVLSQQIADDEHPIIYIIDGNSCRTEICDHKERDSGLGVPKLGVATS